MPKGGNMPALSIMVKPASGFCNMKCEYCFYHDVVCSREQGQLGFMNEETCDNLVDKALAFANGDSVYFVFQGGEPLLSGIAFFEHFVDRVKSNNYSGKVHFSLQTNGTLLNDDWGEFFRRNNFLIGVSLDGDITTNKFRTMADGSPSYDKVLQGIDILDKHKVDYNILSVVTGYLADNIENVYNFFKNKGFKFLQFIPCLRPFGDKSDSVLFMTEQQFEHYLTALFRLYAEDFLDDNYISIRGFDNMVRLIAGSSAEQCGANGYCTRQFVVEGNGNIYPCDFYCSDEWLLGNINDCDFKNVYYSTKGVDFIKQSLKISNDCKNCRCFAICRGGGCKRERECLAYCSAKQNFFENSLPLFEKIIKKLQLKK